MKLVEKAEYKNKYIVAVIYVYGDGDKYETVLVQSDTDKDVFDLYYALKNMPDSPSKEEMEEYLEELKTKGVDIDEGCFWFDYDFDYYADYESLKVTYYDENGYGHHLEIKE